MKKIRQKRSKPEMQEMQSQVQKQRGRQSKQEEAKGRTEERKRAEAAAKGKKGTKEEMKKKELIVPESKLTDVQRAERKRITEFIKDFVFSKLINQVAAYGDSLVVGKQVQQKYEQRPVTKFVFPLLPGI